VTETARITSVNGELVTVLCGPGPGASLRCNTCGGESCAVKARPYAARNGLGLELRPGDVVEISVPPSRALTAGLIVLGVPLVGFALFYVIAAQVWQGEAAPTLAGFCGLVVGFLPALIWKRIRKTSDLPEVSALLERPAAEAPLPTSIQT